MKISNCIMILLLMLMCSCNKSGNIETDTNNESGTDSVQKPGRDTDTDTETETETDWETETDSNIVKDGWGLIYGTSTTEVDNSYPCEAWPNSCPEDGPFYTYPNVGEKVTAYDVDSDTFGPAITDIDGYYELPVPPGVYTVEFEWHINKYSDIVVEAKQEVEQNHQDKEILD